VAPQREWLDRDYYAVLGVSKDASQDEIKKAYRKLARTHHPDANPDDAQAEQRFKEIGEAYSVLGDDKTRREYDELRRLGAAGVGGFRGGGGGFSGDAGFGGFGGDLGDLLRDMFSQGAGGGFAGARTARPSKGADLRADVHLSFEDALAGVRTTLRVTGDGACDTCKGSGAAPGTQPHVCTRCGGSGQVTVDQGPFSIANPCPVCGGRGSVIDTPCATCDGSGRVVRPRELSVRVPAGVKDGAVIRIPKRGAPGSGGGPAGDVIVTVHVEPHHLFGRRGSDVTLDVPITYTEAALGTKLTVPTPSGERRTIRIPSGTQSGRTFRVRGEGAPGRNGRAGDLLVTVKVDVPQRLDRKQRQLVEQLRDLEDTSARDARLFDSRS
jgi:molecular chaperone DnaJ